MWRSGGPGREKTGMKDLGEFADTALLRGCRAFILPRAHQPPLRFSRWYARNDDGWDDK